MSSETNNQENCLNCGKPLKSTDSDFCQDCEVILNDDNFSYYPGGSQIKNNLGKTNERIKNKINLSGNKLIIVGLIGLIGYIGYILLFYLDLSSLYLDPSLSFSYFMSNEVYAILLFIIALFVGIGLFALFYSIKNPRKGFILLMTVGIILTLLTIELTSSFYDLSLVILYIGPFIAFATGMIGVIDNNS